MKVSHLEVVLSQTFLFGLAEEARAQDASTIVTDVPVHFVARDATLPVGTYTISGSVSPGAPPGLVLIRAHPKGTFLLPTVFDGTPAEHGTFGFEHVGDTYFLSKVETPWGVYTSNTTQAITKVAQIKDHTTLTSSDAN